MDNEVTVVTPTNGRMLPVPAPHSAQVHAMAAAAEVQTLFLAAAHNPRNMQACKAAIIEACQDKDLAEEALYSYRRGGQLVEGPSIDLVQEIACIYGRIKNGWEVVQQLDDRSQIRSYAIDIEALHPVERIFWVKHERDTRDGPKKLTDQRDVYELQANLAQRRMRSCIEAMIPKSIMRAAIRQVEATLKAGGGEPLPKRAEDLAQRFYKSYGVTEPMMEKFIGAKVIGMTESQYVRLIAIAKSLKEGAQLEQFFDVNAATPKVATPPPVATPTAEKPPEEAKAPEEKPKRGTKPKDAAPPPAPSEEKPAPPLVKPEAPDDNAPQTQWGFT